MPLSSSSGVVDAEEEEHHTHSSTEVTADLEECKNLDLPPPFTRPGVLMYGCARSDIPHCKAPLFTFRRMRKAFWKTENWRHFALCASGVGVKRRLRRWRRYLEEEASDLHQSGC